MSVALAGRPAAAATGDLQLSALLLLALAIAMSGLHSVLEDVTWWFSAFGVIFVIFTVAAVTRFFVQRRWVGTAAAAIASILVVTVFFASDTALLGVIPTATTVARFGSLISAGNESIAIQTLPAFATPGIQFIVCLAVAGLAIAMDAVAIWLRSPALVGIALLVVVAAPSFVLASITDGFTFELTAVVYLFILLGRGRRIQPAVAITVGVVAVLGALIAPAVLPPVAVGGSAGSGVGILAQNINPIIDLGADLRQSDATPALSYTTTTSTGEYLRLTTLDSFEGKQWVPATPRLKPGNTVADIGRPPGLTPAINVNTVSTRVQVASAASHWLPIPYPSVRVSGLTGAWSWEDDTLSVRSAATSTVGQRYSVTSLDVEPTIQQLEDAPSSSANPLARVPAGLSPIVAATAKKVVGKAKTDFDKAVALQNWFRDGTFSYSTTAPARAGYDGSGLGIIVPFLKAKSGYCVHFATAMAVMARTLGIPSRVAVGFLPGTLTHEGAAKTAVYQVSSSNLHAWPELYFAGIGWVRFEPTPGKGFEPNFPSAPGTSAGALPSDTDTAVATPAPTSTPVAAPKLPAQGETTQHVALDSSQSLPAPGFGALGIVAILLIMAAPAIIRIAIRRGRVDRIRQGIDPAGWAWQELRETARDLGLDARASSTPSELAAQLARFLATSSKSADTAVALQRLLELVEEESYGVPAYRYNGEQMSDELTAVLRGLRRARAPIPRLIATIVPPTLIDRVVGRATARA